jgi:hypothetical protein
MERPQLFVWWPMVIEFLEEYIRVACGIHIPKPFLKVFVKYSSNGSGGSIGHFDVATATGVLAAPLADFTNVIGMVGLKCFHFAPMSMQDLELEGPKFLWKKLVCRA